jgi:hypothetical protein
MATRFDPTSIERFNPARGLSGKDEPFVRSSDYDALLALYNAEREARKDDAREHSRELRDAVAESRWAERQGEDYGGF